MNGKYVVYENFKQKLRKMPKIERKANSLKFDPLVEL